MCWSKYHFTYVNIGNHVISGFSEATPLNFVRLSKTFGKEWLLDSRDKMPCDIHTNLIDPDVFQTILIDR